MANPIGQSKGGGVSLLLIYPSLCYVNMAYPGGLALHLLRRYQTGSRRILLPVKSGDLVG